MLEEVPIPSLDEAVINALDMLTKTKLPKINTNFKRPLLIGSGNAFAAAKIIFKDKEAVFADESSYLEEINLKKFDISILISASGSKHAGEIAKNLKKKNLKMQLWTSNPSAPAITQAGLSKKEVKLFPSLKEPYTYNISTYASMILSKTKENPKQINELIKQTSKAIPADISNYSGYYIILPKKFHQLTGMIRTKFEELFGLALPYMVFTDEQLKHAKDVIVVNNLASIEFGELSYHARGASQIKIALSRNTKEAALMLVSYFVIGKIQASKPPYFKENIRVYCEDASKVFGKKIGPWVDYKGS